MKLVAITTIVALIANSASAPVIVKPQSDVKTRHIIPVTDVGCGGDVLDPSDTAEAKKKMIRWDRAGNKVDQKNWHPEYFNGTVWYLCNCKLFWRDGAPEEELNQVEQILSETCGPAHTGWVWSKPWQKAYNVASVKTISGKKPPHLCPRHCMWAHIGD
ncbi:uncharacterized protein JN550_007617 [Neoarthrinium moseri]|uniref:uncharacterized protein n=1 Tax=Neoarthrinium moseri TaxID=1658444 RepID=UPI001FDB1A0E|nr:uncharacterized protein JN550_007617 [Neoarthrinium moseri]KAI1866229.1 hypothetical protein JN550_007617 [Neoarthrinium moseri]